MANPDAGLVQDYAIADLIQDIPEDALYALHYYGTTRYFASELEALEADGRTSDCVLIIVGGQLLPEPGGSINSWGIAALAWCLRLALGQAWRDLEAMLVWLFQDANPAFRFVYCRMGYMVEEPARGVALRPELRKRRRRTSRGARRRTEVLRRGSTRWWLWRKPRSARGIARRFSSTTLPLLVMRERVLLTHRGRWQRTSLSPLTRYHNTSSRSPLHW